jgi:hypothetical protein
VLPAVVGAGELAVLLAKNCQPVRGLLEELLPFQQPPKNGRRELLGTASRRLDWLTLPGNGLRESGAVPAPDVELVVAPPERTDFTANHFAFVCLGVYHPDPRRQDEDVIDVAARSRDEPIVERDDPVADLHAFFLVCNGQQDLAFDLLPADVRLSLRLSLSSPMRDKIRE